MFPGRGTSRALVLRADVAAAVDAVWHCPATATARQEIPGARYLLPLEHGLRYISAACSAGQDAGRSADTATDTAHQSGASLLHRTGGGWDRLKMIKSSEVSYVLTIAAEIPVSISGYLALQAIKVRRYRVRIPESATDTCCLTLRSTRPGLSLRGRAVGSGLAWSGVPEFSPAQPSTGATIALSAIRLQQLFQHGTADAR